MFRTLLLATLVASSLSACNLKLPGSGAPAALAAPTHQPGMWQKTTIEVRKIRNAIFRDKKTGKQLEPAVVASLKPEDTTLEPGDFDEVYYNLGRLRYAFYSRDTDDQPYVVERVFSEADFDALDTAFYDDHYFNQPKQNWDANQRLPLYYVLYQQASSYEGSFTPNLGKLPKVAALIDGYIGEMGGDKPEPKGVKQLVYASSAVDGKFSITLTEMAVDDNGDAVETEIPLDAVKVDLGSGFQAAVIPTGGKGNTFTFSQPAHGGDLMNLGLQITPKAPRAAWNTTIPIRSKT